MYMVDLDLRRLRILREVPERGTLAAVASALGYSPSAISQQLAALEQQVGVPLLRKSGRGVRLTPAGELLAARAGELIAAAEVALTDLSALSGEVSGTIRAVGLQSALRRLLIPALVRVGRRHPALRVELAEMELEQALPELRLGRVDVVLVDEYAGHPRPRPAGLRFEPLLREPMFLALPADHPLAADDAPVPMTALRDEVWAASERDTGHTAMVLGSCRSLGGFDPDLRHLTGDAASQLALVRQAGVVALIPALTTIDEEHGVALRTVAEADLHRTLSVVTRTGTRSAALRAFLAAVATRPPGC